MVLPLNLAMTPSEIATTVSLPERISWMSCHFCPYTEGITNTPEALPEGAMLILTDRENCSGHSRDLVAQQLLDTVQKLHCESVLLDFQRPPNPELEAMVTAIVQALPCPEAVTESYAASLDCPVFLPPCPLHIPMEVTFGNPRRFAFSVGGYADLVMNSHTKIKYHGGHKEKVHNFPTNFIQAGATARVSFHDFSIFCSYQPTQIFKTGRGPEAQQWTIGIGF